MAEARHLDRAVGEQRARPGAVADGAGADADGVDRHLEEGVEGDDLVDVAAAQVHPVGERVGELRRDRPDLAPDAAEVVEQPRPLGRQLLQQAREPEHVHARESTPVAGLSPRRAETSRTVSDSSLRPFMS